MARNGSGTYQAPSNSFNPAVVDTTIDQDDWNTLLADLETALSDSIARNGETATTAVVPFASGIKSNTIVENSANSGVTIDSVLVKDGRIDTAKGSDIASATTTDIGAMTGNYGDVTGTTTITGLGTVTAGNIRIVQFDGALTLTHNGTTLIIPGAANITTAAGDIAGFVSEGAGNWRMLFYTRAVRIPDAAGPSSATDNALVRFDGTTGKVTQDSGWTLSDAELLTAGGALTLADYVVTGGDYKDTQMAVSALGDLGGGTDDIDYTAGHVVTATVSTSTETFTFSNFPAGYGAIVLFLTNGGSQTINWPAAVSSDPTGLTAAGVDKLLIESPDGGTTYYVTVLGRGI